MLKDALVEIMASDRHTARMSDDEVLSVLASDEAKQVPILMERAVAIQKARRAVKAANEFLNIPAL